MLSTKEKTSLIFVTVGNATQPFTRLLNGLLPLIQRDGQVRWVIQYGSTQFAHPWALTEERFPPLLFDQYLARADVVICHAGAGTLLNAWKYGHMPVVMPRLKAYNEHIDDHQYVLAHELAGQRLIIPAFEPENLPEAIAQARRAWGSQKIENKLPALVRAMIEELG